MSSNKKLLELNKIKKIYVMDKDSEPLVVLNDLSLQVFSGDSLAITGPSGSGKSTLLNIIGALDNPDSGKVIFDEQDISSLSEEELAMFRNQKIGFVFQLHHLLPHLTVLENVLVPAIPFNLKPDNKIKMERAIHLLKRVGLDKRANHMPGQLSGGERQRTAVVRALINAPQLLLADEPTGSLDKKNAVELVELLKELNKEEKLCLIMVTHSMELAGYMKKIYSLQDGKLK